MYSKSKMKTKASLLLGFTTILVLFYSSILIDKDIDTTELILVIGIITIAFLFDISLFNQISRIFKQEKKNHSSVNHAIEYAIKFTLKKKAFYLVVKNEFLTFYYAFFAKYENKETPNNVSSFSYSKLSNTKDIFLIVAIAQIPTLPLIHLLLEQQASILAAYIFSFITLWSVIWYLAQVQAVIFRPIELQDTVLKYRFGLACTAEIPLELIKSIRKINSNDKLNSFGCYISPIGSTKNILLEFNSSIKFKRPYQLSKNSCKAAISVDNPEAFMNVLSAKGVNVA